MTLDEFRDTRVYLRDMGPLFGWGSPQIPGYVYLGDFYINENEDGTVCLETDEPHDANTLAECERILYEWVIFNSFHLRFDPAWCMKAMAHAAEQEAQALAH